MWEVWGGEEGGGKRTNYVGSVGKCGELRELWRRKDCGDVGSVGEVWGDEGMEVRKVKERWLWGYRDVGRCGEMRRWR